MSRDHAHHTQHETDAVAELFDITSRLESLGTPQPEIEEPLNRLIEAANRIGKAWSGSHWGYHATVYYAGLRPPPAEAMFTPEWGLMPAFSNDSVGDWERWSSDDVVSAIYDLAGNPDLSGAEKSCKDLKKVLRSNQSEIVAILANELTEHDAFIEELKKKAEKVKSVSQSDFAKAMLRSGQLLTHDSTAATQGPQIPPHIEVLAKVLSLRSPALACLELSEIARKAESYIARKQRKKRKADMIGTNVFIGHGKSHMWRDLKDFIKDRLHLPFDEFNRIPVAGVTNIARLSEMLDSAVIAFLVMTGEDEQSDGKLHARMNVVHEAGLFQGRLGFSRAIVLLEAECEEFSNIQGLGQIRFPKGNINAAFEDIRMILEREGIISEES